MEFDEQEGNCKLPCSPSPSSEEVGHEQRCLDFSGNDLGIQQVGKPSMELEFQVLIMVFGCSVRWA